MAEIIVAGNPEVPEGPSEAVIVAQAEAEQVYAEARIDVAEIEAARDVSIAETHAETEQAAIEAAQAVAIENATREEVEECRRNIGQLQQTTGQLAGELSLIRERLETLAPQNQPPLAASPGPTGDRQEAPEPAPKPKPKIRFL